MLVYSVGWETECWGHCESHTLSALNWVSFCSWWANYVYVETKTMLESRERILSRIKGRIWEGWGSVLTAIICAYEKDCGLRTQKAESRTCGEQITLSD